MSFSNDKKNIDLENLDLSLKLKNSEGVDDIFGTFLKYIEKDDEKEKGLTFSNDIRKFNDDINNFVKYVRENISDENIGFMFSERKDNVIRYGKKYKGIRVETIDIDMISNDDLKNIYELLKNEFNSSYDLYFKNDVYSNDKDINRGNNPAFSLDFFKCFIVNSPFFKHYITN